MFRNYTDCVRTSQDDTQSSSYQCNSAGYVCDMCPAGSVKYITETDVEIHRKKNHFKEIVRVQHKERFCYVCMKLQPNYSSLISHLKTDHLLSSPTAKRVEREIYICDYCNHIFFNKQILEVHIQYKHLYDNMEKRKHRYFKCPKCVRKCNLVNVWFHFQKHDVPSVTVCDICIATFPDRKQLREHLKIHPMLYRCETCFYTTNKESLFNLHLEKHESRVINLKRKVDGTVKRVFRRIKKDPLINFNIHNLLKGLYLPNMLHICTLCREICTDKIDMRTHVLRDHLYKENLIKMKYICSCGEEFSNKILIKQHVFKLKGEHRILLGGELPETSQIRLEEEYEQVHNTLQTKYTANKDIIEVIEASGDSSDSNEDIVQTDKITTNKQAEDTDVTITRLTDEQADNNIVISTDSLVVITGMANKETDVQNEMMTTNGQILFTDSQIITSNGQIIVTNSEILTTDSQMMTTMTTDSEMMTTNSEMMIADSEIISTDS